MAQRLESDELVSFQELLVANREKMGSGLDQRSYDH
jgi:hypothetical protein